MKRIALAGALLLASPAWGAASDAARLAERAQRVTITRDHLGIAHVRAGTDADAVFGMAYAQAEDDFNRVETNYLTSLGRLSEADGEAALWKDLRQRLWIDEARLKADYARSPAWLRALMDGWADGLNHYLAANKQVRPRVLTRFEPWMALSFSEGSIGGDIEYVSVEGLKALYGAPVAVSAARPPREEPQGSNGIAIAPKRTANGKALLLINPHTSFFFRDVVQVTSGEGLNVYGAVTWGQFFVYQGFNAHAGWMHTTSGLDNRDEFAETIVSLPEGARGYRYGKEVRPMQAIPVETSKRADGVSPMPSPPITLPPTTRLAPLTTPVSSWSVMVIVRRRRKVSKRCAPNPGALSRRSRLAAAYHRNPDVLVNSVSSTRSRSVAFTSNTRVCTGRSSA